MKQSHLVKQSELIKQLALTKQSVILKEQEFEPLTLRARGALQAR